MVCGIVFVSGGFYGWIIKIEVEVKVFVIEILKGKDFICLLIISGFGYNNKGIDIGNIYVEVDKEN